MTNWGVGFNEAGDITYQVSLTGGGAKFGRNTALIICAHSTDADREQMKKEIASARNLLEKNAKSRSWSWLKIKELKLLRPKR